MEFVNSSPESRRHFVNHAVENIEDVRLVSREMNVCKDLALIDSPTRTFWGGLWAACTRTASTR